MKNINYIDKVLKHIRSKSRREQIERELYDHIDEKEKWFVDIGYDEVAALDKSEESMGDADIVGEQLSSIKQKSGALPIILSVLLAVPVIAAFTEYAMFSSGDGFLYFIFVSVLLIFSLLLLFVGIKRKSIIGQVAGYAFSAMSFETAFCMCYADMLSLAINSRVQDYFYYDFTGGSLSTLTRTSDSGVYAAVKIIFHLVLFAIFATGLIVTIKTRKLRNRRIDLKLIKIARTTALALTVTTAVATLLISIITITGFEPEKKKIYNDLGKLSEVFVQNIDDFITDDGDKFLNKAKELYDIYPDEYYINDDLPQGDMDLRYYDKDGYITVLADSEDNTITIDKALNNIFGLSYDCIYCAEDISNLDLNKVKSIYDMPLPAEIRFNYNIEEKECTVEFGYANVKTKILSYQQYVTFKYNPDKKDFELYYSNLLDYDEKVEFTEKQDLLFRQLANEELGYMKMETYTEYTYCDIVSVEYNSALDLYKVNFYYQNYTPSQDSEGVNYVNDYLIRDIFVVKLYDDKAVLVCDETEYYSRLSDAYDEFLNRDSASYQDIYSDYKKYHYQPALVGRKL